MPILFFASGFAALLYQVAWAKRAGLVLGADIYGVSLVLFAFMTGLAVGGKWGGRWADRTDKPAGLYAKLEFGVGILGLVSLGIFELIAGLYPTLFALTANADWLRMPIRGALALAAIGAPAVLMGATFPVMAKLLAIRSEVGAGVSRAYAWNTWGACAGALGASFALLPQWGIPGTIFFAAAIDGSIAVLAMRCLRATQNCARSEKEATPSCDSAGSEPNRALFHAAFLSGFAALVFEVVLTRNLAINFGATSYAFATVLFVFLLGIGLGSALFRKRWDERESAREAFSRLQILVATLGLLCPFALERLLPHLFLARPSYFPGVSSLLQIWAWQFLVSVAALLPLGVAFGLSFPAAIRAVTTTRDDLGASAGNIYWWNTWGAAAGALAASFILIPWLGSRGALALAAGASLLGAWRVRAHFVPSLVVLVLGAAFLLSAQNKEGTALFLEGPAATVSVEDLDLPDGSSDRIFRINGRVEASTGFLDMRLQRLLGALPVLLHPDPQRVLVVGLGAGVTAGASASSSRVRSVQVIELNPEVKRAADLFGAFNRFPLLPPEKLRISFQDAGNYLLGTQERFDVITSDPIHPRTSGSGNLYTVEYFQRMRARLSSDGRGIAGQWVPLYQLAMRDIASIFASFREAFPHAEIWLTSVDLVLIGSQKPLQCDEAQMAQRMKLLLPGTEKDFEEIGIYSAADLLALRCGGTELIDKLASQATLNRDLYPFLEYSAPFSALIPYQVELYEQLLSHYPNPANASQKKVQKALESFLAPLRANPPRVDDAVGAVWEVFRARE